MRAKILVPFLLLAGLASAADPLKITWPESPVIPQPMPAPNPVAVERLAKGQWYVIESNKPLLVEPVSLGDGRGSVSVKEFKGPLTLPAEVAVGRLPDKTDPDVCTVAGPFVYVVKSVTNGKVSLIVLPALNDLGPDQSPLPFTRADISRRTLEVDAGNGPQPPPVVDPVKPVDPVVPVPTPSPKADQILAISVEETFNRNAAVGKLMLDPLWEGLKAKGGAYLHVEKDDPILTEKKWGGLLTDTNKNALALPAVLVLNRATGEKLGAFAITDKTTPADLTAKLKEFQK